MVDGGPEPRAGSTPPIGYSQSLSIQGSLKRRMGCISFPGLSEWPLGHPKEVSTHQHLRTQGDTSGATLLCRGVEVSVVGVFSDTTTALAYLSREGGTHSTLLTKEAWEILDWAEMHSVQILTLFVRGSDSVVAD